MMFACVIEQCISSFISVGIHRKKDRGSNKEHLLQSKHCVWVNTDIYKNHLSRVLHQVPMDQMHPPIL